MVGKPELALYEAGSEWWREILARHSFAENRDESSGIPIGELLAAADAGFLNLQGFLGGRSGSRLEPGLLGELQVLRWWVRHAMLSSCGDGLLGDVKGRELELLQGIAPLTFCEGTVRSVRMFGRRTHTWLPGCRLVFEDTSRAAGGRRSYWLSWCPEHQAANVKSKLMPAHVRKAIRRG